MLMICIAFGVSLLRYHMRGKALEQQSHKIWASCFKDLSCLCLSQALVGIGMMLQLVIRGGKERGWGSLPFCRISLLARVCHLDYMAEHTSHTQATNIYTVNKYLLPLPTPVFVFQDLVAVVSIMCGHPFLLPPIENTLLLIFLSSKTAFRMSLYNLIFPF